MNLCSNCVSIIIEGSLDMVRDLEIFFYALLDLQVVSVTRDEIGNPLDEFKTYICGSLSSQLDTMGIKLMKEEEELHLAIFFSKCWKNNPS